jgi:hypothetical protein
MVIEFSIRVEGLPLGRRALRDQGIPQLILVSPVAALLAAYFAARRTAPFPLEMPRRRIYTLRQLLFAQYIFGLLLGWWAYTRREEIGQRRMGLDWQARDQAAKAIFGPYDWNVATWRENDLVGVIPLQGFAQQPVTDTTLELVARQGKVVTLGVNSNAVTDEGLNRLSAATHLRTVEITSSRVTDKGLHSLSKVSGLETLIINSPHVTLEGLKRLPSAKSLRTVAARGISLTDDERRELCTARPDLRWEMSAPPVVIPKPSAQAPTDSSSND